MHGRGAGDAQAIDRGAVDREVRRRHGQVIRMAMVAALVAPALLAGCGPSPLRMTVPGQFGDVVYRVEDRTGRVVGMNLPPVPRFDEPETRQGRTLRDVIVAWVGNDCPVEVVATVSAQGADAILVEIAEKDACATDAGRSAAIELRFDRDIDPDDVTIRTLPSTLVEPPAR